MLWSLSLSQSVRVAADRTADPESQHPSAVLSGASTGYEILNHTGYSTQGDHTGACVCKWHRLLNTGRPRSSWRMCVCTWHRLLNTGRPRWTMCVYVTQVTQHRETTLKLEHVCVRDTGYSTQGDHAGPCVCTWHRLLNTGRPRSSWSMCVYVTQVTQHRETTLDHVCVRDCVNGETCRSGGRTNYNYFECSMDKLYHVQ